MLFIMGNKYNVRGLRNVHFVNFTEKSFLIMTLSRLIKNKN